MRVLTEATTYKTGAAFALCAGLLCSCAADEADRESTPIYEGVETRLLDGDLVNFAVTMRGARDKTDVAAYTECAAAQYALIRGYGFARHLRTTVTENGKIWSGDAVYTISAAIPKGLRTIDAEITVDSCHENKIPTV